MENNTECVFCNIANKSLHANILSETDNIMIIQDILPKAPVHVQVMPKRHIETVNSLTADDKDLIADLILAAKNYASQAGIGESGYKLVMNVGKEGGQVIPHLHMHLLGGKQLEE
jgi:histidine triad (HIT) family protein